MTTQWLSRALEESRARGFLGPGPIEPHIEHAKGFAACWDEFETSAPHEFLDLGSGGGVPGLILLELWSNQATLVDSMVKRTEFLREVLAQDGAPGSGSVVMARAEDLAREEPYEEAFSLVTARSFGPPSVVAECAVRFLRSGGMLVVSEPPDDEDVTRWNPKGLEKLGLQDLGRVRKGAAYRVLRKIHTTPREFPRAVGIPKKSPLF